MNLLFLVEGPSDKIALEQGIQQLLERYYPGNHSWFAPYSSDITSKYGITPENIEKMLYKLWIDKVFKNYRLQARDIDRIIQIVDVDGAYIPDEDVILKTSGENNLAYTDKCIFAKHVLEIRQRNERKRNNLDALVAKSEIKLLRRMVPYRVYFFSCNLDHYLHGERNLDKNRKRSMALDFLQRCGNFAMPDYFCKRMTEGKCALPGMNYQQSWAFIRDRTELNSLSKASNLGLLLKDIIAHRL